MPCSTFHYRITVNGAVGPVLTAYPGEQWSNATQVCEDRGLPATFERRLITDPDILDLIEDTTGYLRIGDRVICPWEVVARMP